MEGLCNFSSLILPKAAALLISSGWGKRHPPQAPLTLRGSKSQLWMTLAGMTAWSFQWQLLQ